MGLKETIIEKISKPNKIVLERYRAAKITFIICVFLFFVNFYFVWVDFYADFFIKSLVIFYILLLLSLVFYIYFFIKKTFIEKLPNYIFIIILAILIILFGLLTFPVILDWGISWLLWYISK